MVGKKEAKRPKMLSEAELEAIEWDSIPEGMPKYDSSDWKGYSYKEVIESDLSRLESARAFKRESREKPAAEFTDRDEMREWLNRL